MFWYSVETEFLYMYEDHIIMNGHKYPHTLLEDSTLCFVTVFGSEPLITVALVSKTLICQNRPQRCVCCFLLAKWNSQVHFQGRGDGRF